MKLYSINNKNLEVSLREAVLQGLAPDGGLFMPRVLPQMSAEFFSTLEGRSLQDISYAVAHTLLEGDVPEDVLRRIVEEAINFDAPLTRLDDETYVLELFHGPTLAFKDFGARFMARLMGHFVEGKDQELTILVATSGDTGSAVAHGFLNVPGIRVIILYPSGGVSLTQEKMLTTLGGNITALEVKGTFDDCQKLVKQAFVDQELRGKLFMSSANSINIARLIPQMFYYFYAYGQLVKMEKPVVFSVPSGNFGHLTAGLMAKRIGLPAAKFVAACNANDVVTDYLRTGQYKPRQSQKTLSNAMDVGSPSNFARMLELYGQDVEKMRADVWSIGCTDAQTREVIKEIYEKYNYILDPHGAVGYWGLKQYRAAHSGAGVGVFFETASAAKFPETVEEVLGIKVDVPERMRDYVSKEKQALLFQNSFEALKAFLLSKI
ncbi:threonine synthase [Candidatus Uhrbacteria bacterium]|nr:threonine synthase [Candidatus Uhrbacteria bacterium]